MFREKLFALRARCVEVFHESPDESARARAFDMILRINARLLRGWTGWKAFPPGWGERMEIGA